MGAQTAEERKEWAELPEQQPVTAGRQLVNAEEWGRAAGEAGGHRWGTRLATPSAASGRLVEDGAGAAGGLESGGRLEPPLA